MNPKKKIRMQKALARRQMELQSWIDDTSKVELFPGQSAKTKIAIAERDITSLIAKLGYDQWASSSLM